MVYIFQKIFLSVMSSFFIAVGFLLLVAAVMERKADHLTLIGAAFFVVSFTVLIFGWKRISKFQRRTYQWYKETYRLNVDGARVTCFSCGSVRIQARGLMNHTYTREHYCSQCGTTLYYSPEAK